jgi:hypothetical protein
LFSKCASSSLSFLSLPEAKTVFYKQAMPSTPRFPNRLNESNSSAALDGSVDDGPSSSYILAKDRLVPPIAPSHLAKALSPLNGDRARYESVVGTGSQGETMANLNENVNGASTSQLPVVTRTGLKEEENDSERIKWTTAVRSIDELFATCFKSGRMRAWEKSRRIEGSDFTLTKEVLNEQLRPEEEGLVPLNAIAGRVVLYGWQLFANQVEM